MSLQDDRLETNSVAARHANLYTSMEKAWAEGVSVRLTSAGATSIPEADMENARLGVIYLFSKISPQSNVVSVIVEGALGSGSQYMPGDGKVQVDMLRPIVATAGSVIEKNVGGVLHKPKPGPGFFDGLDPAAVSAPLQGPGFFEGLEEGAVSVPLEPAVEGWVKQLIKKIVAELKTKFMDDKFVFGELKGLIVAVTRLLSSTIAPFIKGGIDVMKGLAKMIPVIVQKFKAWQLGQTVEIVSGHQSITIEKLKKAMTVSIFEGLYTALKGGLEIGLTAAPPWAPLVKLVVAVVEMVIKILWRLFELFHLTKFCGWCREAWLIKDRPDAPHKNADVFVKKYNKITSRVPAVAALTLNSGICGDKLRFLRLFSSADQASFNAGAAMIDGQIKPYAASLLKNLGMNLVITDKTVKALVDKAKQTTPAPTRAGRVVNYALDVLSY